MTVSQSYELARIRLRQASEVLDDAQLLMEHGGSTRSVVNRAYYAAFYAVHAVLQSRDLNAHKHAGIIATFDREFVASGLFDPSVSRDLHQLFDLRQEDDYTVTRRVPFREAEEAHRLAEGIVEAVRSFLNHIEEI